MNRVVCDGTRVAATTGDCNPRPGAVTRQSHRLDVLSPISNTTCVPLYPFSGVRLFMLQFEGHTHHVRHLAQTGTPPPGRQKRQSGDQASPEAESPPLELSHRTRQAGQQNTSSSPATCSSGTRNSTRGKKTD